MKFFGEVAGFALALWAVIVVLYLAMRFVRGQARSPGRRRRAAHRISGLLPSAIAVQLVAEAIRAFVKQG